MSWNISDIHNFIRTVLIRKERNVFVTDADIDSSLDRGQMDAFADYSKEFGRTQAIHDALTPFKTPITFTIADTPNGVITLAADYMHYLGGYIAVFDNTYGSQRLPLQFVNEDELVLAMNSQVRKPSLTRPFAYNNNGTIQLYPEVAMSGAYSYLRRPATPFYNTTISGRTVTYNPTGSTQLEWNDAYISNIIQKALVYLGVEMEEGDLVQFANLKDQQTK